MASGLVLIGTSQEEASVCLTIANFSVRTLYWRYCLVCVEFHAIAKMFGGVERLYPFRGSIRREQPLEARDRRWFEIAPGQRANSDVGSDVDVYEQQEVKLVDKEAEMVIAEDPNHPLDVDREVVD